MKKAQFNLFAIFMALVLNACFVSCGSDDDDVSITSEAQLVGKWILRSANGERYSDDRHYIMLNANGTYSVHPSGNPYGLRNSGTWSYEDSYIILDYDDNTAFIIKGYTPTTLTISNDELTFTFERDGAPLNSTAVRLIGKWVMTEKTFIDEETISYDSPNRYMILNADFTFEINPRNLFEAEKTFGTWALSKDSKKIIFNDDEDDTYRIIKLNSTTLQLGWLEYGDVIEWSTFTKVQ